MEFSPRQASLIAHSTAFINIADGAVRSGKTHGNMIRFAEMCADGPPGLLAVFGKTGRTVKHNVVHPLKQLFPGRVKFVEGAGELTVFGRTCAVIGANDVGAADKVQGLTLAGSLCNELALYPENMWKTIIDRHSVEGAQILGDCNPNSPYHYLNREYLSAGKSSEFLKRWRFKLTDNPVLSQRYKDMLLEAHPPGTLWHKRMILGEWVAAEGAIYEQWDERIHVVDKMPGIPQKVVVGVDYGTQNATVFLALGLVKGTWYVFSEYHHSGRESQIQKTDAEYSSEMAVWLQSLGVNPTAIYIDPSAASFKVQLKKDGVRRVRDADNSVEDGIRVVSTALTTNKLKVLKRCEELRSEFPSYVWNEKKAKDTGKEAPLKGDGIKDHALDALRYACMGIFGDTSQRALRVVR